MKHWVKGLVAMVVLALLPSFVFAQNNDDEGPATIEELYLMQDIQIQTIRSQALSQDRDVKLLAIENIRAMVRDGVAGDTASLRIIVETLAGEGTLRQQRQGGRIVNDYPLVRRQAATALGELGGEESMEALVRMLPVEGEPIVSAEAIHALGQIGMDPDGRVSRAIVNVLNRNTLRTTPDNFLAFFAVNALQELIAANGGSTNDPEVVSALLEVASGNYTLEVRNKARAVIQELINGASGGR